MHLPKVGCEKGCKPQPLQVKGVLTWDPEAWKTEFWELYNGLFADTSNTLDAQTSRLQNLLLAARSEDWIVVPLYMVRDVIAAGRRKAKTRPGQDGISWGALAAMSDNMVESLRVLIEKRVNCVEGHVEVVDSWLDLLLNLIPKKANASLPKEWRPIAISSCLQKAYMRVVAKLVDAMSRPPLRFQAGFTEGAQVADVSELHRVLMQKSHQWGVGLVTLKCDVNRAFDEIRHETLMEALAAVV